jgi:hypothetical protein
MQDRAGPANRARKEPKELNYKKSAAVTPPILQIRRSNGDDWRVAATWSIEQMEDDDHFHRPSSIRNAVSIPDADAPRGATPPILR